MDSANHPLEVIFRSTDQRECRERSLVLKAAGIDHQVVRTADQFVLAVSVEDAPQARAELTSYSEENRPSSKRINPAPEDFNGWSGVLIYAAVLTLITVFHRTEAFGVDWFAAGMNRAGLTRQGEWWRAVTALTLHADVAHLAANLVFGGLIGLFAGQMLGSGPAWFGILIAGTAGNLLNAAVRHTNHTSIGASTAVFAALGLLAACNWSRTRRHDTSMMARFAPLIGAAVLLSFLGTGGERTDIPAHLFGFLSGLIVGTAWGLIGPRIGRTRLRRVMFGSGSLFILALAWAAALIKA
ncbi:MAG TPA: rhomboid family intramembrane serine protease [Opitutaceae bacterium]